MGGRGTPGQEVKGQLFHVLYILQEVIVYTGEVLVLAVVAKTCVYPFGVHKMYIGEKC